MTTATTKQVRKIGRNLGLDKREAWANKLADERMRSVAFRIAWSATDEQMFATKRQVEEALFLCGFAGNKVKVTQNEGDWASRSSGGTYLRITALAG